MFKIEEVMKFVPHRYPFLLIDRVKEFEPGARVVTLKNVTINEAQFAGHFPGRPIFPGVYIIENMAQSGCFLLAKTAGGLEDGKVFDFISRTTPTGGADQSFVKNMLKGLLRFG